MNKRLLSLVLASVLFINLVACSQNTQTADVSQYNEAVSLIPTAELLVPDNDVATAVPPVNIDRKTLSGSILYSGVYTVGKDIDEGRYLITAIESDYGTLDVVIFDNEIKYENYMSSKRLTHGEENRAIELNAMMCSYVEDGKSLFVGLETGMILKIEGGVGEIDALDDAHGIVFGSTLYAGFYIVGKDINEDFYTLDNKENDNGVHVIIFESLEKYEKYMTSERFTVGEETQAIEDNSKMQEYIHNGDTLYVGYLETGMVLKIEGGVLHVNKGESLKASPDVDWEGFLTETEGLLAEAKTVFEEYAMFYNAYKDNQSDNILKIDAACWADKLDELADKLDENALLAKEIEYSLADFPDAKTEFIKKYTQLEDNLLSIELN